MAAVGQARLTVLPHEAVLLNSLRKLLSVVPQTEHTIAKWAGGAAAAPPTPSSSALPGSPLRQGPLPSIANQYLPGHYLRANEDRWNKGSMQTCGGSERRLTRALLNPKHFFCLLCTTSLLRSNAGRLRSHNLLVLGWFVGTAIEVRHGVVGAREPTGLGTERMPSGSDGPELGAQFAQLVKELRSEYAGAVTACAARIAQGVFGPSGRSILRILEQHGITGTPTLMQQQASLLVPAPCAWPIPFGSIKKAMPLLHPLLHLTSLHALHPSHAIVYLGECHVSQSMSWSMVRIKTMPPRKDR